MARKSDKKSGKNIGREDKDNAITEKAVAEGGAYEVIRNRLKAYGENLHKEIKALNSLRLEEFGQSAMSVQARVRIRTENNCIARDIVQVGSRLLFGYNVFIGLKKETKVDDVFSLYEVIEKDGDYGVEPVDLSQTFLADKRFVDDFEELYRFYKQARLLQLTRKNDSLLAGFQIGERLDDIRVFRWQISPDGQEISYIDNRGERDLELPPSHDFEWKATGRDDVVRGKNPHINIADSVFVETLNGTLTFKVENNTETGLGVYSEPVDDETQSLDDAQVFYAVIGRLVLVKIRPYREEAWRYYAFNQLTQDVTRIDAINDSCVQLPEDHGIVFPGGYYLEDGHHKLFDNRLSGFRFKRKINSPNGEDTLYIFYEPVEGALALLAYNLIEKQLSNPMYGHGYALRDDGQLVIFTSEEEPTRVHPMQIWSTPYQAGDFLVGAAAGQTALARIGNAELVKGISSLTAIHRSINEDDVSMGRYEELLRVSSKVFDEFYWLEQAEFSGISSLVVDINKTAELVIDEFEKVESIRSRSEEALKEAILQQESVQQLIETSEWTEIASYLNALIELRRQRGHLATIRQYRYIDTGHISKLDESLQFLESKLSDQTVNYLVKPEALEPYHIVADELISQLNMAKTRQEVEPVIESIQQSVAQLNMLSDLMATLNIADATVRTNIIESISAVYGKFNACRAQATNKRDSVGLEEAVAQFAAQSNLFSQSISYALGLSATPDTCDEQLARLLVQLEEMEGEFGEYAQFIEQIVVLREELYQVFESHRQQLVDAQQSKAQSISDAALRILSSIEKRCQRFSESDELHTYMASDALVIKFREMIVELRKLDAAISADELEAKIKQVADESLRSIRDKAEIFDEEGQYIQLGPRHRFSVNSREIDLTIMPRNDELTLHISGTDYFEPLSDGDLQAMKAYWSRSFPSESEQVYRGEYLAYNFIRAVESGEAQLSSTELKELIGPKNKSPKKLQTAIGKYASERFNEGYEKGVHDHDAEKIISKVTMAFDAVGMLRFLPKARALGQLFWASISNQGEKSAYGSVWPEQARAAKLMRDTLSAEAAVDHLRNSITPIMRSYIEREAWQVSNHVVRQSIDYLIAILETDQLELVVGYQSVDLVSKFRANLSESALEQLKLSLSCYSDSSFEHWALCRDWLLAYVENAHIGVDAARAVPEAASLLCLDDKYSYVALNADVSICLEGLLGAHEKVKGGVLNTSVDRFLAEQEYHAKEYVPSFYTYFDLRKALLEEYRDELAVDRFIAKPMSAFVRNKLISEVYLPLIGDNFAKQMGSAGDNKRTDLMGLLMMISPPGYGKTTLMEYVASRLGLIFVKVNCPSLGHRVYSLDPEQASSSTARQELEKLNLAFEMGSNVMLYLDDIQHTSPEFLQKFISLCDATRRVDGVWRGSPKTYDMRGKKFCVVMAGNPYTESGEVFKIPDMLANRADVYNLGDILGGKEDVFELSYIENALTSNNTLSQLVTRDPMDVFHFVDMAKGKDVASTELSHDYSGAEVNEIVSVLEKLFVIRDVVLKVNKQYIASAAQDDKYRTEPAFKLQGSYRNMNKMAEKVSAVMNEDELLQLISDHYVGEAQLLTSGSEENLLKLAELSGNMSEAQSERWEKIKREFRKHQSMGGDEADIGAKVVSQLAELSASAKDLTESYIGAGKASEGNINFDKLSLLTDQFSTQWSKQFADSLGSHWQDMMTGLSPSVNVVNQPVPGVDKVLSAVADTLEHSISPLVRSMDKKLDIDLRTYKKIVSVSNQLRSLEAEIASSSKPTKP